MMTTDAEDMNSARNAVLYGGKRNSIVEWTLSAEWNTLPQDSHGYRGEVQLADSKAGLALCCDEIVGEINGK